MNTAFEVLTNIANMIGPALAGVLIALTGPVNLLWITTFGFLVSAVGVTFLAPHHDAAATSVRKQLYLDSIREGFAFIAKTRVMLALAILFGLSNFISNGFTAVGLPVFVFETWGTAARLGVLFTALGVGTLTGALLYGTLGHHLRAHRRRILVVAFSTQPIWISTFLWSESLPMLLTAMFLIGFVAGPTNPMAVTVRFEHIPAALHGRVFATFSAITATITPLGIALSGMSMERFGVHAGVWIIVIAYTLLAVALPFVRVFGEMNTPGPYADEVAD